jgi:SpoVK/Ycf46/Vps4 family AAA+-type ATPase
MATAEQLKALIRTHAERDDDRFFTIALQVAAHAARTGHGRFALELREVIDEAQARAKGTPLPDAKVVSIIQPRGELAGLLSVEYPKLRLGSMALDEAIRRRLQRVLLEQRHQHRLHEHGFGPLRKLLLVGPPGTGKTTTAGAIAAELGMPLFTIQLDGLITKYMGETAAKLRLIFDAIRQTTAVYLFDEFDALGGRRAATNDVGEIRRVLNSFLLFLEQDNSSSLLLAATNHPELLDRALFRRFDAVIEYAIPTPETAQLVLRSRLALLDTEALDWVKITDAAQGLSHADLTRASETAAKEAILSNRKAVETKDLLEALRERHAVPRREP